MVTGGIVKQEKYTDHPKWRELTPEKALWCTVFVTFFEDMNHYIRLKSRAIRSREKRFDLSNKNLDTAGFVTRDNYINLIDTRQKRLLYNAKHEYIFNLFELLNLNHSTFVRKLEYMYEHDAKVFLNSLNFGE